MPRRVLVIEDNTDIARLLKLHLRELGCDVRDAQDGHAGLEKARVGGYDLIILDLMLPGVEGLEICRQLRAEADHTPILMLTAKSEEADRVAGLEIGADDYLTKPFSIKELVARVKAIFRRVDIMGRGSEQSLGNLTLGEVCIDFDKRHVDVRGAAIELTQKEFDLLGQFARNPGRVYSRTQLLDLVWGYGHSGYEHTVNSHINRLRSKIEKDPTAPEYVLTVWGVGYKFADITAT